jgi:hypothetical protein
MSASLVERLFRETQRPELKRLTAHMADTAKGNSKIIDTEVSLTALRRGNNYIINGFVRDITDRIQAERDRDRCAL